MHLKSKLKLIIEDNSTRAGRIFDFFIQTLIIISLISFCFETLPNLSEKANDFLNTLELITVIIFSIEYVLRILVADNKLKFIFSFFGIIDILAILPFYLSTGIDLRSLRVFRILRIFRAMKIVRYSTALKRLKEAFISIRSELVIFFTITLMLIFISSVCVYYFENPVQPDIFSSVFTSMWWSVATLTTVGYGDIYPLTVGGRIFTFFMLMIGLGIVAVPSGLLASALSRVKDKN